MMKKIIVHYLFCFGIFLPGAHAQLLQRDTLHLDEGKIATLPYYSYGKGIGMTSPDSLYQLTIRFRMQNRLSYIQDEGAPASLSGQVRRLRLRLEGYVGDPRFLYLLQLSFAPGDVGPMEEGRNLNIIRDAVVFYRPNRYWSISFGQTKLPGNRQRFNSSGALQFTDRSINNARFNIDRDFGLQIHQINAYANKFSYNFKAAITMGEGRNWTQHSIEGLAYTGKVELYPFGTFKKEGDYFEGDLMREPRPKVMLSAAFHQNSNAVRTQGQTGEDLYEARTMQSVFIDGVIKYRGFALMGAYMSRMSANPLTVNPQNGTDIRYAFVGQGVDIQGSYIFKNNYEVMGRYSVQHVDNVIHAYTPHTNQIALGLNRYIWEHAFKIQSELGYSLEDNFNAAGTHNWFAHFQIEIGI